MDAEAEAARLVAALEASGRRGEVQRELDAKLMRCGWLGRAEAVVRRLVDKEYVETLDMDAFLEEMENECYDSIPNHVIAQIGARISEIDEEEENKKSFTR